MSPPLLPDDPHDSRLIANVRPLAWVNPTPAPRYNLVAIGAGAAGLVSAGGAGGLGAKVALIERQFLGGDCLIAGCVPSKTLLAVARERPTDFAAVMERVRQVRADISPHDSAERFRREFGVDVFFGEARFTAQDALEVGGQTLHFRKAVIATGSRPVVPDIPGMKEAAPLTNETVFSLTNLPRRLTVIGGGSVGCELAQAFARLGSRVTLLERGAQILSSEDEDTVQVVTAGLRRDGIDVRCHAAVTRVEAGPPKRVYLDVGMIEADAILVATGRTPNIESLNLDAAGIRVHGNGLIVDDHLRTTNRRVFAAGDVAGSYHLTHAADAMARLVIRNALFLGRERLSRLVVPWCLYTDPEFARVGLTEREANQRGVGVDVYRVGFDQVDRAITDGRTDGFVKVLTAKGTDRIVGAAVVGPHAGELIGTLSLAMTNRLGLKAIAGTVFPYPTYTEALKKVADAYNRTRLTPFVARVMRTWLRWTR